MQSTILLLTKSTDSRVLRKSASLREVNYNMALQNAKEKKSFKGTTVNRNIDVMQKLWDTVSLLVFKQSWRMATLRAEFKILLFIDMWNIQSWNN